MNIQQRHTVALSKCDLLVIVYISYSQLDSVVYAAVESGLYALRTDADRLAIRKPLNLITER
jgi:hypothetical protein